MLDIVNNAFLHKITEKILIMTVVEKYVHRTSMMMLHPVLVQYFLRHDCFVVVFAAPVGAAGTTLVVEIGILI